MGKIRILNQSKRDCVLYTIFDFYILLHSPHFNNDQEKKIYKKHISIVLAHKGPIHVMDHIWCYEIKSIAGQRQDTELLRLLKFWLRYYILRDTKNNMWD